MCKINNFVDLRHRNRPAKIVISQLALSSCFMSTNKKRKVQFRTNFSHINSLLLLSNVKLWYPWHQLSWWSNVSSFRLGTDIVSFSCYFSLFGMFWLKGAILFQTRDLFHLQKWKHGVYFDKSVWKKPVCMIKSILDLSYINGNAAWTFCCYSIETDGV